MEQAHSMKEIIFNIKENVRRKVMSWKDTETTGGSNEHIKFGPNTTKQIHILLAQGEEPYSYWTHYIPNVSNISKAKGRVVICPGKAVCPACAKGTYKSTKKHSLNVYDYETKSVKIMEAGNQIMQQLKLIYDQYGTFDNIDVSIRRIGEKTNTTYVVMPFPREQPFDGSQLKYEDIKAIKEATPIAKVAEFIHEMEGSLAAPAQIEPQVVPQPVAPPVTAPQPATPSSALGQAPATAPPTTPIGGGTPVNMPATTIVANMTPTELQPDTVMPSADKTPAGDTLITFGKHRGKTLGQIMMDDIGYVEWLSSNADAQIKAAASVLIEEAQNVEVAEAQPNMEKDVEVVNTLLDVQTLMNAKFAGNFEAVVKAMKKVTASPTNPNGKTMLNEYTPDELSNLYKLLNG